MGELRDKYTYSTNISDILFFVYVKNSPIILENVGASWKKWGKKPIPRSRSDTVKENMLVTFSCNIFHPFKDISYCLCNIKIVIWKCCQLTFI